MNLFYFTKQASARLFAAVALFSLVAGMLPMQAFAVDPVGSQANPYTKSGPNKDLRICHVGNKGENYVVNNPSWDSIDTAHSLANHNQDIIPSFWYLDKDDLPKYDPGRNWEGNDVSQEIWRNNCSGSPSAVLTVKKVLVDEPNTVGEEDFSFTITGSNNFSLTASFESDGSNDIVLELVNAPFTVVEVEADGQGYQTTEEDCSAIDLTMDGATCTITNTFEPVVEVPGCMDQTAINYDRTATIDDGNCSYRPTITITKQVTNDDGGGADGDDFTFRIDGQVVALNTPITVEVGAHTVSEDAFANYTPGSWANHCAADGSITTQADTNYICSITNDDNDVVVPTGTLHVEKVIVGGPTDDVTTFSYDYGANTDVAFEVGGTDYTLEAGTSYAVTENSATGYNITTNGCSGDIVADTTSTCTITNTWIPTCTDRIQNQGETGVDTGGPCGGGDPEPDLCTVTVVSDTSDFVVENDEDAVLVTFIHDAWDAVVSGASWIWGDDPVVDPVGVTTYTFEKKFGFVGAIDSATLYVASDNTHSASVNGNAPFNGGSTFAAAVSYDVESQILQGNNELEFVVTNEALDGGTTTSNPAGLLYKLVIEGEVTSDADCSVPYVPPVVDVCLNIPQIQTQVPQGYTQDGLNCYNNNDEGDELSCEITANDLTIRRGGDVTLTWTSVGAAFANLDGESTTTAGSLFVENLRSDTTYTMTVYNEQEDSATCSVTVDTRSGGGGSNNNDDDEEGQVLGDSDSVTPEPLVLGEQVSAVPTGAPDTGKGGAAGAIVLGQLLAAPRRIRVA